MTGNATLEQENIIKATEGYVRCGAVPGSGKTFCITHRMAYLIKELYIEPSSVVALTFTNKAANSMTRRLQKMIGDEATCFTGTFHGFCNKILKEEIYRLSYPKTFTILDKKGQIDLIREIAEELQISLKDFTAKHYLEEIGKQKIYSTYISYLKGTDKSRLLAEIAGAKNHIELMFYHYLLKQRDNYVLDFEDILNFALYILKHYQDALETWQEQCQYILCDEYQDVNDKQEELLKLLSGKYQNLTVVGDDDQCIYGWRGSKVDYIVEFDKAYPDVKDYYLSENFRSTPEIIAVANSLIKENQHRLVKKMFTNNPSGTKPVYNHLKTESDEGRWIAETIADSVHNGKKFLDHAVLVRASSQTRALEEAFIRKRVPYKILNGAQFYSSEEIKTVLAYLRMIYSMNDLDFVWTIQRPRKGFGKKSIATLKQYAEQRKLTLIEALGEQIENGMMRKSVMIEYYRRIMELHATHQNYSAKDLVNAVLDIGYRQELENDVDQTKLDNVSEFITTITALEEENKEWLPLEDLLAHFALFSQQDDDVDKDVVKIMTIHTAKGLEFDTVFVNGMVEGQFPSKRLHNADEREEERRLFYVAVTRAMKKLYISSYASKGGMFFAQPSSFLSDIDPLLLDYINNSKIGEKHVTNNVLPKNCYSIGDKISHKLFGNGVIVGVDEKMQVYTIQFEHVNGVRRLQFRAELTLLS